MQQQALETSTASPVILYGAPLSLFSGRVRAYLSASQCHFVEHLPSHKDMQSKIIPAVGRQVLPCVEMADGTILQDTTDIIQHLEHTGLGLSVTPKDKRLASLAHLLELFGDEGLLRPAMHYRWNYRDHNDPFLTWSFARTMMPGVTQEDAPAIAGPAMDYFSSFLPPLGITPDTTSAIEEGFIALLAALEQHFTHFPYLLGHLPSIADYGFFGPLYAHLARDPYPSTIMKQKGPRTFEWCERMMLPPPADGSYADFETLAQSLAGILEVIQADFLGELKAVHTAAVTFLETETPADKTPLKRSIGNGAFDLRGSQALLSLRPYSLWMLQRFQDNFDTANSSEKGALQGLLNKHKLGELPHMRLPYRIEREQFREVWCHIS